MGFMNNLGAYVSKGTMGRQFGKGFGKKLVGTVKRTLLNSKIASAESGTMPIEFQSTVDVVEPVEKTAASFLGNMVDVLAPKRTVPSPLMNGAMFMAGTAGVGAALAGIGKGIEAAGNYIQEGKYDASLKSAIKMSPTLQMHGYAELRGYMPMIIKASPTVAAEPRLLANYLESMIDAEGHLNMATFGELVNLEGGVLRNRQINSGLRDTVLQGVVKGTSESTGKALGNLFSVTTR